jgi:hypothetical protein
VAGPSELAPDVARWLTGEAGRAVVAEVTASLDAGADELAIATRLRRDGLDASSATAVTGAAHARRRARSGGPTPTSCCSRRSGSSRRATPRSRPGERGGSPVRRSGTCAPGSAATRSPSLAPVLRSRPSTSTRPADPALPQRTCPRLDVAIRHDDALAVPVAPGAAVHVDPGRRRDGRRVRLLAQHLPPVGALLEVHADAPAIAVVLSPRSTSTIRTCPPTPSSSSSRSATSCAKRSSGSVRPAATTSRPPRRCCRRGRPVPVASAALVCRSARSGRCCCSRRRRRCAHGSTISSAPRSVPGGSRAVGRC